MYLASCRYRCDACGVTSESVEVEADVTMPLPPDGWMRLEGRTKRDTLDVLEVIHLCVACRPQLAKLTPWRERKGRRA